MDEALIDNWNSVVNSGDTVYHLGDFAFASPQRIMHIRNKLNGSICLLRGNHDKQIKGKILNCFEWVKDYYELKYNKRKIVMCHYPYAEWNGKHHYSINLHAHSHGKFMSIKPSRQLDVGVDCHNYTPINIDNAISIIEQRMKQ